MGLISPDVQVRVLQATSVKGPHHFTLRLLDAATSRPLGHRQVDFDGTAREFAALRDLSEKWKVLERQKPNDWLDVETALVQKVGTWTKENILGDLAGKLAARAPAMVWIDAMDPDVRWLREVPLGIAITAKGSLARQRVAFVVKVEPPEDAALHPVDGERLRVLAVFSAPTNQQALNLRHERHLMAEIARELIRRGKAIDLKVLQYGATLNSLKTALDDAEGWDIVHLSGHGTVGLLLLEDENGQSVSVQSDDLVQWLMGAGDRLKLVTLTACSSAAVTARPWLESMGIPTVHPPPPADIGRDVHGLAVDIAEAVGCTVVAMRYPVRDGFAIDFTRGLYSRMWVNGHTAVGAMGLATGDAALEAPTHWSPARSAFTPAAFGNLSLASARLGPPDRAGPPPNLTPRMANFLAEPKRFVGRVDVLAAANKEMTYGSGTSAVILHGIAGVGKTQCALEIAYGRQDDFAILQWFQFVSTDHGPELAFDRFADGLLPAVKWAPSVGRNENAQWLAELTETMEQNGILLVLDGLDVLLTDDGGWLDPRWAPLFDALCNHEGSGRLLVTSRRLPSHLLEGVKTIPVPRLNRNDALLLVRQLPHLSPMLDGPKSDPSLAEVLGATRGHPALLELADACVGDPGLLKSMLDRARNDWPDPGTFLTQETVDRDTDGPDRTFESFYDTWGHEKKTLASRVQVDALPEPTPEAAEEFRRGEALRDEGKTQEAEQAYRSATEHGDPEAAFRLGDLLWTEGRPDDAKVAFEQAARAGFGPAKVQLGWLVLNEDGDRSEAASWWRAAAEQGHTEAAYQLAELLWSEGKPDDAMTFFTQAAESGHVQAAYQLGWLLKNEKADEPGALYWWKRAATPGHVDAAFQVGELLRKQQNNVEAKTWYQIAHGAGHQFSAYQLGEMLYQENSNEALEWMHRAVIGGVQGADTALQRMQAGG